MEYNETELIKTRIFISYLIRGIPIYINNVLI